MRILRIIERTYEPLHDKYVLGRGGASVNNRDICTQMAQKADMYLLTYQLGTEEIINGIHYAPHTKMNVISGMSPRAFGRAVKAFIACKDPLRWKIKEAAYQIDHEYINKYIKKLKPDIVNIVGIVPAVMSHIDCCKKAKIPVVVSLHGIMNTKYTSTPEYLKMIERDFCIRADKERIPVITVSAGTKNRLSEMYDIKDTSNYFVISNGIKNDMPVLTQMSYSVLLKRYGLDPNKKVVICSGTVTDNKNQCAVVRAWSLLPKDLTDSYQLVFTVKRR